jgi:hypothetical protein
MNVPFRGGALTLLLVAILLAPPSAVLEQKGGYADVRGDIRTGQAIPVEVKDTLIADPWSAVPRDLGPWQGTDDRSWPFDALQRQLAYDTLMVRDYDRDGFLLPAQVMVLTARHGRAFHNPEVCFNLQSDNGITDIPDTTLHLDGIGALPVGRFAVHYEDAPPKLVYNVFLQQEKFSAPTRTTWLRIALDGADESTAAQAEPFLTDLLERIVPHAFAGRSQAKTTWGAIEHTLGPPIALAAALLAAAPLVAEAWWLKRSADRTARAPKAAPPRRAKDPGAQAPPPAAPRPPRRP